MSASGPSGPLVVCIISPTRVGQVEENSGSVVEC